MLRLFGWASFGIWKVLKFGCFFVRLQDISDGDMSVILRLGELERCVLWQAAVAGACCACYVCCGLDHAQCRLAALPSRVAGLQVRALLVNREATLSSNCPPMDLPDPRPSPLADEWKLEHEAKKAAEEKAAAAAATADRPPSAAGDQEMAEAGPSSGGAAAGGSAASTAAGSAGAADAAGAGAAGGKDKEKKKKTPEELACDILLHFAHTARAFGQVGRQQCSAVWAAGLPLVACAHCRSLEVHRSTAACSFDRLPAVAQGHPPGHALSAALHAYKQAPSLWHCLYCRRWPRRSTCRCAGARRQRQHPLWP